MIQVSEVRAIWRLAWVVTISVSLLVVLGGCALLHNHRVTIPADTPVGRIVISGDALTIDPSTVPSGDVYFAIEGSPDQLGFVTGMADGPATPPLTDADIERLSRGDRQGFSFIHGMVGEDGIVYFLGLSAGKYAFILDGDGAGPGDAPRAIAILTVLP